MIETREVDDIGDIAFEIINCDTYRLVSLLNECGRLMSHGHRSSNPSDWFATLIHHAMTDDGVPSLSDDAKQFIMHLCDLLEPNKDDVE